MRPPSAAAAAVSAAALVVLAACGAPSQTTQAPPPAGDDPGLVHVHGLGLVPAESTAGEHDVYVATHTGLHRLPADGGAPVRVGTALHDLMGFTVAAPDRFLASGHPDLRVRELQEPGKPPLLGLVESTDRGETWRPLSLLGEADFHRLRFVDGVVYGHDATSGRLLRSTDGTTWDERTSMPLADFVVDPGAPDVLLAATAQGVERSDDGGATWSTLASDRWHVLAWGPDGVYGAADDGRVGFSVDGRAWEPRAPLPGAVEALTADGGRVVAAVHDAGIFTSDDGGERWHERYAPPRSTHP